MADNDVRIKLSLDGADDVKKGLQDVGDSAGDADSKLGGMVKGGLKGAGVALAGFATAAVGAGAALTTSVVNAYAEYEQNVGGIETLFGDAADTMKKYADDAYKTAGLSANEYMSNVTSFSASLLQGLGGDTAAAAEVANQAMVDMSDNANKFGSNIADVQNAYQGFAKQNYTMLDNLKLGYGGTAAEMARLINDSGVMGDTFEATAANINEVSFDKIIEGIHVVQTELGVTGTTALEAEETISGSIGMLQSSWQNLLTGLGSTDADVATLAGNVISSFESVVGNIAPIIENIGANIATLGPQLGSMSVTIVDAIASAIPAILEAGVAIIGGLIEGISGALPSLIKAAVPAVLALVDMIVTQLPLLIDAGLKAVVALAEGIVGAIPELIPSIIELVVGVVDVIMENLPMLLEAALELVVALAEGILEAIPVLLEYLPQLIISIVEFIVGAIPMIIQVGIQLLMSLVAALPEIIMGIVAAIPLIIDGVLGAILGAIPLIVQAGLDLLLSIVGALPEIILGVVGAIPLIIEGVIGALTGAIPQLISTGLTLITSIVSDMPGILGTVVGSIPEIITGIVGALLDGAGQLVNVGYDLISGMWEGISSAGSWLTDKVLGWAGGLLDSVTGFFGIFSPSRVFRDEVGKMLPAGMGEGIDEGAPLAEKSMDRLNQMVLDEANKLPTLTLATDFGTVPTVPAPQLMATTPNFASPLDATTQADAVVFNAPLVQVAEVSVRSDEDIRALSEQLRADMSRELRAQGVLS